MVRVGWLLQGDRSRAASRLQGFLIHEWLLANGYHSELIADQFYKVSSWKDIRFWQTLRKLRQCKSNIVVFEGGEWPMHLLARIWRLWGRPAIGVRCDLIHSPYDETFNITIVPTEELAKALSISRYYVIDDPIEVPDGVFKRNYSPSSKRLKVVWVGHDSYGSYITSLITRLRSVPEVEDNFEFIIISKGNFATIQWSLENVIENILCCDIAIIPIPQGEWFQTKSANRLAMMMALGMPVIASPIPSYAKLIRNGINGILLKNESTGEFTDQLLKLKDQSLRQAIGMQARSDLADNHSVRKTALNWVKILDKKLSDNEPPPHYSLHLHLAARLSFFLLC